MFCYGIVESQVGSHNYFEIERAKKIDLMRVENLTYLKFKDADFDQCLKWFEEKEYQLDQDAQPNQTDDEQIEGGFHTYY